MIKTKLPKLTTKIEILETVATEDGVGGFEENQSHKFNVWAKFDILGSKLVTDNGKEKISTNALCTLRSSAKIDYKDTIRHLDKSYKILEITLSNSKSFPYKKIYCEEL